MLLEVRRQRALGVATLLRILQVDGRRPRGVVEEPTETGHALGEGIRVVDGALRGRAGEQIGLIGRGDGLALIRTGRGQDDGRGGEQPLGMT